VKIIEKDVKICISDSGKHEKLLEDKEFGVKGERELVSQLFESYDTRTRPVLDSSRPINISLSVVVIQISDVVSERY